MKLNFKNRLQKLKYQFKMNPMEMFILITFIPGYVWMYLTQSLTYIAVYMLYMILLVIINIPSLKRKLFYKPIGDSKIFVTRRYPFCKWVGIYQNIDKKALSAMSKVERKKHLVCQKNLMDELPKGRYRTVTHDTIAERIKGSPQVSDCKCVLIYKANLKRIQKNILKDDKTFLNKAEKERPFYFVEFVKM